MRSWPFGFAFALSACGRIGFDNLGPGGAADAPPLSAVVCAETPHAMPEAADVDLAITPLVRGYAILAAKSSGGPVIGARFEELDLADGPRETMISADAIGSVFDIGQDTLQVVASEGGSQVLYTADDALFTFVEQLRSTPAVIGRDPIITDDARSARVFVNRRAATTALEMTFVNSDGTLGVLGSFVTANPITEIAGDSAANHGHIAWVETPSSGTSSCTAADVFYDVPPNVGSQVYPVSDDCRQIRAASGPGSADSLLVVHRTSTDRIVVTYIDDTGTTPTEISTNGRAPKARFDGTRFWIAWIDTTAGEQLRVATYDFATRAVTHFDPIGRRPAGDEAFELVRRGDKIHLVVFATTQLSFLELCR